MIEQIMLKALREDTKKALESVEKKYGVEMKIGNISYTFDTFTMKVEGVEKVDGKSMEQLEFERYCSLFDLKPKDYLRKFSYEGKEYVIVEIKPKSTRFPIVGENVETKQRYKFTISVVKNNLL